MIATCTARDERGRVCGRLFDTSEEIANEPERWCAECRPAEIVRHAERQREIRRRLLRGRAGC